MNMLAVKTCMYVYISPTMSRGISDQNPFHDLSIKLHQSFNLNRKIRLSKSQLKFIGKGIYDFTVRDHLFTGHMCYAGNGLSGEWERETEAASGMAISRTDTVDFT